MLLSHWIDKHTSGKINIFVRDLHRAFLLKLLEYNFLKINRKDVGIQIVNAPFYILSGNTILAISNFIDKGLKAIISFFILALVYTIFRFFISNYTYTILAFILSISYCYFCGDIFMLFGYVLYMATSFLSFGIWFFNRNRIINVGVYKWA